MTNPTKLRPFYIAKYLYELTDDEHTLTTTDIINKLEEDYGISTYRQTVASDIEILRSIGIDIQEYNSTQKHYSLASRTFDLPELKILIDAVLSAKFITEKKSKELVGKLSIFAGKNKAEELQRNISVENRVKKDNEQIYLIIDAIDKAITKGYKISFRYYKYDGRKEKCFHRNGEPYIVSPHKLVWNGEYYYMIGINEDGSIRIFRLDRIEKRPEDLPFEKAQPLPEDFDWEKAATFRMFGTDLTEVQLICANDVMDAIIDRFGMDVKTYAYDMEHFRVDVEVPVSNVFFSWVFGFGGKVWIQGPKNVKQEFIDMIQLVSKVSQES